MEQETYDNIRNKIIDYLARQSFSERKLLLKVLDLKRRYPKTRRYQEYTHANVQKALDDLSHEGVIDDRRYAREVLEQLMGKTNGVRRIAEKMSRRLIPQPIIDEILREFSEKGRAQDNAKIIKETLRKRDDIMRKHPGLAPNHRLIRSALYTFLARKGYMPDDIAGILDQSIHQNIEIDDE